MSPVQPIFAFHTKLWLCRLATDDHVSQEEEYCRRFRAASQPASENAVIGYNASSFCFFYEQLSSHSATNSVKNVTATILKSDGPAAYREVDWSMIAMKSRVKGITIPSRRRPNWRFLVVLCLAGAEVVKWLRPANSCSVPGTHLILLMHFGMNAVQAKIRNDHFRLLFRYQMAARKGLPLEGASVCGRQPASTSQSFALV